MTDEAKSEKQSSGSVLDLPRSFWTANVMELFERGAYYGLIALLARYLTDKTGGGLGFTEAEAGLLTSLVYAATYVVPILGGALADRYGYRKMLLVAFSLLSAGHFLSGQVTGYGVILATLLLMATGSGLFKPIISGTIARTTDEKTSGFGFGIYYWMINLGALIAPFIAGWLKGFSWSYVFTASSLYCAAMLLPAIFIYKDPPKPESSKSLKEVLGGAMTVLSDARFMLLIFVYSCFWILYFQMYGTVVWYLRDFIDPTPVNESLSFLDNWFGWKFSFDAEHVTIINAATIVLLQIVVSRIVRNFKPLPTMVCGILFGICGFLFLAASQSVWIFVIGIAVFSIGEMTCHPKYYSYIGMVAPQDKKAVYMGYAFLYGVIGSLVGANLGGEMYEQILNPLKGSAEDPSATLRNFWLMFAIIGGFTMGALILYNKLFSEDTAVTRRRARSVVFGIYGLLVLLGPGMVLFVRSANEGVIPPKTWIQAGIMLLVGVGGLLTLTRGQTAEED